MARIAYLASDVVVSVVPSLATDSEFSEALRTLQKNNAPSVVAKERVEVSLDARENRDELSLKKPSSFLQSARIQTPSSQYSSPFARASLPA